MGQIKWTAVRIEILTAVPMKNTIFWDTMPCVLRKICQCYRGTYCFYLQSQKVVWASACRLILDVAYSSSLKIEVSGSSETSINFYQTIRRIKGMKNAIPRIRGLQNEYVRKILESETEVTTWRAVKWNGNILIECTKSEYQISFSHTHTEAK
jgi:hypothetical protein